MNTNRRIALIGALVASLSLAGALPALAADELNVSRGLTAAGAPLALHGYDPVAFFTVAAPTAGRAELSAVHEGATYYFASRENLEAFEADPDRYAPAFGGFCTFGVAVGKKFDGDPRYWTVSGDRLYLNLNREIFEQFNEDVAGNIAKAEKNWKKIEHEPVGEL
jgi:YHS domain-containing protein